VPKSIILLMFSPGMFLYAKLVLNNLLALPTRLEVINAIQHERFPQGLKDAYVRDYFILRLSGDNHVEANWTLVTTESLNV